MLQIACKSEILAPKCNKKHANQRFWLQNAASSKENCPRLKKKKHPLKKQYKIPKKNHHPSSSNFVPLLLQHAFKASDLVPDIFQSNIASRYVFILPTSPFSLQTIAFSQLPHSEVSLVYFSHSHIDSFRSLPFDLKFRTFAMEHGNMAHLCSSNPT